MIDRTDIQGNVIEGYNFSYARYLHFALPADDRSREFLGALEVTNAEQKPDRDTVNVAFTARGLEALGVDLEGAGFPADFVQGMAHRTSQGILGDIESNFPKNWDAANERGGPLHEQVDMVVIVQGNESDPEPTAQTVKSDARSKGLVLLHDQSAAVLSQDRREHFGFRDGISQPVIEGAVSGKPAIGGAALPGGLWARIPPGEFILGYPDLEERAPALPDPPDLVKNGSYLVYRKLQQDVAAFRTWVKASSEDGGPGPLVNRDGLADTQELVKAKIVGRWPDGTPLMPCPAHGSPSNDFHYADDPYGDHCPLGSHIRRTYPRDGLGFEGALVDRHRLIRRGMPYGPQFDDQPDTEDRGLIFIAYCASIARQYEFVQRRWINEGDGLGVGHGADPLVGTGATPKRFIAGGARPVIFGEGAGESAFKPFVTVRFGAYFFQPGLRGLKWLARLDRL
jgi:Dyp-type peroxidase family